MLYPWESRGVVLTPARLGLSLSSVTTLPIPVVAAAAFMVVTTFDSEPPAHISGWRAHRVCQPQHIQDSADLVPWPVTVNESVCQVVGLVLPPSLPSLIPVLPPGFQLVLSGHCCDGCALLLVSPASLQQLPRPAQQRPAGVAAFL